MKGPIKPTDEALAQVKARRGSVAVVTFAPDAEAAESYREAQAQALLDAFAKGKKGEA